MIERDGKFELVSATDMQADTPTAITDIIDDPFPESSNPLLQDAGESTNKEGYSRGKERKNSQEDGTYSDDFTTSENGKQHSPSVSSIHTQDTGSIQVDVKSTIEKTTIKETSQTSLKETTADMYRDPLITDHRSSETVEKSASEGCVPSVVSKSESGTNTTQSTSTTVTLTTSGDTATTSTAATSLRERTTSAPELRMTARRRRIEAEIERRKRNEAAYNAWLTKKNAQIAEQCKLERVNNRPVTREELQRKREQCKNAYTSWLGNKKKEATQMRIYERAIKSATVGANVQEQSSTVAFQKWLEQKQLQRRKEHEIANRKIKEEEEIAVNIHPDIANQAYRRYGSVG